MKKYLLGLAISSFFAAAACAKLPIQTPATNDNILSGGSDTEKPNSPNPDDNTTYPENHALYLGMPYPATTDAINSFDNYLINRTYLSISYNKTKGIPNWVAWHLSIKDLGTQDRGDFIPDPLLPFDWIWIDKNSYTNSGFDRGHSCPSGDRTIDLAANNQTFYMTNIIPQAPRFNQQPWAQLEDTIRTILKNNNYEAYIYNGNCGIGGTNATSFARKIKNNTGNKYPDGSFDSIWVPMYVFKIVLFLPEGENDLQRITSNTDNIKILAVFCPNDNVLMFNRADWNKYITNIKSIEDSLQKYKDIETDNTNMSNITNPLNPPMSFYSQITDEAVKTKIKNMKWMP